MWKWSWLTENVDFFKDPTEIGSRNWSHKDLSWKVENQSSLLSYLRDNIYSSYFSFFTTLKVCDSG